MRCEAPDSLFYAEIRDFNLQFLRLIASVRQTRPDAQFGLDPVIAETIGRFNVAQLEAVAATPCLLARFNPTPRTGLYVAESAATDWDERARLFATGLLTFLGQMARRDPLQAALCLGGAEELLARDGPFRDIRSQADRALQHLEARFRRNQRFWPDLIQAARDGHSEQLQLARLAAIQLTSSEGMGLRLGRVAEPKDLSGTA